MPDTRKPIQDGEPIPGHYKMALVKGGWMVAVRIAYEGGAPDPETGELTEDERFICEVNGEDKGWEWCLERWPFIAKNPVDAADYRWRLDYAAWARTYDPSDPAADPHTPAPKAPRGAPAKATAPAVDLNQARPVF